MKIFISALTLSRIALAIIIFISITQNDLYLFALIAFFIASISDYFDGYLARKYNAESMIGEILDPIADKILIVFSLIALSINLDSYFIGFTASIIISREIWVAALRDFNARKQNNSATKVTFMAKIKTTIQLFTILLYLLALYLNFSLMLIICDISLLIATFITLYTGFQYTLNSFQSNSLIK